MKGIVLAGGSGSRLAPVTDTVSKQLLPVYDKPMVYYPVSTLMDLGIRDILILSTPRDLPNIERLLGDGTSLGLRLTYRVQEKPNGIAECFLLAADWIDEPTALILGDNLFFLRSELPALRALARSPIDRASVVLCRVPDPERFGVAECDADGRILRIEEKPRVPASDLACTGLYFYPADVVKKARTLRPSARGELEITDLNNLYLQEGRLSSVALGPGSHWMDAGTPDALLAASMLAADEYRRHRSPQGYLEAMAMRRGLIGADAFESLLTRWKTGTPYREHLRALQPGRDQ